MTPDVKEIAERKGAKHGGLDVDDAVGRVGMDPVQTISEHGPADVAWDRERVAAVQDRDVLMDVKDRAFTRIAAYAVDRLARRDLGPRDTRGAEHGAGQRRPGGGQSAKHHQKIPAVAK